MPMATCREDSPSVRMGIATGMTVRVVTRLAT